MKYLALIPLVLVASCASRPKPQVVVRPLPPPAVEPIEAVRYAEVVRAYHVGRYVDPNHPLAMHEQHPVYRVEASARWNLHPGPLWPATTNLLNPPPDAAFSPPPVNDAVIAEIGRQREATDRVITRPGVSRSRTRNSRRVIQQMQTVVTNQVRLSSRLADTEQRVANFAKELQRLAAPARPRQQMTCPQPSRKPVRQDHRTTLPTGLRCSTNSRAHRRTRQMPRNENHNETSHD